MKIVAYLAVFGTMALLNWLLLSTFIDSRIAAVIALVIASGITALFAAVAIWQENKLERSQNEVHN